jgi:hypothetical protein
MDSKIDWSQAPKTELTIAKHLDFFARGGRQGRMPESLRPANKRSGIESARPCP